MSRVLPTAGVGCVDQRDFHLSRVCEPGQVGLEALKAGVRAPAVFIWYRKISLAAEWK